MDALHFICAGCGMRNHVSPFRLEFDRRHPVTCHQCGHRPDSSDFKQGELAGATPVHRMIGKEVVVRANGIRYEGVLVELTESSLALRGTLRHIEIPMEHVSGIESKPLRPSARRRRLEREDGESAPTAAPSKRSSGIQKD